MVFDLSKQESDTVHSTIYDKNIIFHKTPAEIIYKNKTEKIKVFSYEVDNEYFNSSTINYRLVCEKMLNEISRDSSKVENLNGTEIMRRASGRRYSNETTNYSEKTLDNLYDVHSFIYNSTISTREKTFKMFLFGGFIAYFLFFTASIIKYFNLRIYLTGLFISTLIYFIYMLFINFGHESFFYRYKNYIFLIFPLIIALTMYAKKVKRRIKINLFQIIVYSPFLFFFSDTLIFSDISIFSNSLKKYLNSLEEISKYMTKNTCL